MSLKSSLTNAYEAVITKFLGKSVSILTMLSPEVASLIKDILLAVIGPISAIISAYLTNRYNQRMLKEERKDRLLTSLVTTRFKALQDINRKMTDAHFKLNYYANIPPQTLKEYNDGVKGPVDEFEDTLNQNAIWLDEEAQRLLDRVRGAYRQMRFAIFLSLPSNQLPPGINPGSYHPSVRNPNWQEFIESFEMARIIIRERLEIPQLESHLRSVLESS